MDAPMMGDRVREIVTGREGIITGFTEYLWGCQQFLLYIEGEKDKEGDPKATWYDVSRLEILERGAVQAIEYQPAPPAPPEPPEVYGPFFKESARPRGILKRGLAWSGPDHEAPVR